MRLAVKSTILSVLLLASTLPQNEAAMPISQELRLRSFREKSFLQTTLDIRGGAKRKSRTASLSKTSKTVTGKKKVGSKDKTKSAAGDLMTKYKSMLPLTRIYITMVGFCTLLGLVLGDEITQAVLALDPMSTLFGMQYWRFISAASFLGKPSISWLMSGYYLFQYGTSLERAYGAPQYLVFLLTQMVLLSCLSIVTGQPFFAASMITAMLHVLSRAMPTEKVNWLIFKVPYWSLPYGLMAADVLQAQSASAAVPHITGILSGHFYHFNRFVWPKTGGQDWLVAPDFLVRKLDPNAAEADSASKKSINKALKSRRKGKGKKLGGKK
ncbi:unnamed protein product [Cylindrotheca closterium]|uniref:Derlin n=1 Tax=Cylindrotheca closterium TaxID=2856 RepID=A0AAD2JNK4_9STRA|nr:unnamed protein product [Cylindrotheca closterium]